MSNTQLSNRDIPKQPYETDKFDSYTCYGPLAEYQETASQR